MNTIQFEHPFLGEITLTEFETIKEEGKEFVMYVDKFGSYYYKIFSIYAPAGYEPLIQSCEKNVANSISRHDQEFVKQIECLIEEFKKEELSKPISSSSEFSEKENYEVFLKWSKEKEKIEETFEEFIEWLKTSKI
jgi:hypothetical protein